VQHFYILEKLTSLEKVIGFCFFGPAPRSLILPEEVQEAINAATGWDLSIAEMLQIGERATNLARLFNQREGFSRKDDVLPERMYEPLENGALQGEAMSRQEVEHALTVLYRMKGWDEDSGMPTPEKLAQLDLGWAADLVD
jgi:aldehyde:ferredoxin oxidoreductase